MYKKTKFFINYINNLNTRARTHCEMGWEEPATGLVGLEPWGRRGGGSILLFIVGILLIQPMNVFCQ